MTEKITVGIIEIIITGTVTDATTHISGFADRLETLGEAAETTLVKADETLTSATEALDTTKTTVD